MKCCVGDIQQNCEINDHAQVDLAFELMNRALKMKEMNKDLKISYKRIAMLPMVVLKTK